MRFYSLLLLLSLVATSCNNRPNERLKGSVDRLRSIHRVRTMQMQIDENYKDGKDLEEFLKKLQLDSEIEFMRTLSKKYEFRFTPRSREDAKDSPIFVLVYRGKETRFLNDGSEKHLETPQGE